MAGSRQRGADVLARAITAAGIRRIFTLVVEDQVRFPLKLVNTLCTQFSRHGLQFFKVKLKQQAT